VREGWRSVKERRAATREDARVLLIAGGIGLVSGLVTALFLGAVHEAEKLTHETAIRLAESGVVPWATERVYLFAELAAITVLVALLLRFFGWPTKPGAAEHELNAEGRIDPAPAGKVAAWSLLSLSAGAAVGPEAALVDMTGGLGTWMAERFKLKRELVSVMTYAAVAGAFAGFFTSPIVGPLLAIEFLRPMDVRIDRRSLLVGLVAGAFAYVPFVKLLGSGIDPFLVFPEYEGARLIDLAWAVPIGVLGCLAGIGALLLIIRVREHTSGLRERPYLAALTGGGSIALTALVAPNLLYSGQTAIPELLAGTVQYTALALLLLAVAKIALMALHLSSSYYGGTIFPLIFSGTALGLAFAILIPQVPAGVMVVCMITAVIVAASPMPFSAALLLAVAAQPNLIPVVAVAAASSYVVRQAIIPGVPPEFAVIAAGSD